MSVSAWQNGLGERWIIVPHETMFFVFCICILQLFYGCEPEPFVDGKDDIIVDGSK